MILVYLASKYILCSVVYFGHSVFYTVFNVRFYIQRLIKYASPVLFHFSRFSLFLVLSLRFFVHIS